MRRTELSPEEEAAVRILLRKGRREKVYWDWIADHPNRPVTKREANKFLLGCTVDYFQNSDAAWRNVRYFAETDLGDPEELWLLIARTPFRFWMARMAKTVRGSEHPIHRFTKAHERVWRIAQRIVSEYSGDARNIWLGCEAPMARERLFELGLGEQLSRMAAIGLLRTKRIRGPMDVKADRYVMRVVGRVFRGQPIEADEAVEIARRLYPRDPSLLDGPLFLIGSKTCHARVPACLDCCLSAQCSFYRMANARSGSGAWGAGPAKLWDSCSGN
jgi:hypothetical protein